MSTGSELRDRRESAGISLEVLSSITSIRLGLLSQMEANDFSKCGGDTYARGHLKNIAQRLGLEGNHFVEMFNTEHAEDRRGIHELLVDNNVAAIPREARKLSWKVPALFSVLVLLVAGTVQIVLSNQSSTPSVVATPTASPSISPSISPTISPSISPEITTETATAAPEVSPSVSAATTPVTLILAATRGNSFINVVVDGKSVIKGSIFQGETKSFSATTSISVYLSNPAGLDVTHNGKLLSPLGGQNQEVRRTFR